MTKAEIFQIALESGLCDVDLSNEDQLITDYGDATDAILKFAAMVACLKCEKCGHSRTI